MSGRPIKKHFKWSLETRLLLVEKVTMVDGDHASKLQTIEKVMQMLCGTTAEAAAALVATIPITQQAKWEDVASRLQSIFDDSIAQAKRWSICHSQFVKLQQYLKFMKPHENNSYRRANGKRGRIMKSKLCQKLTEYHAAFRLKGEKKGSGQRLSLRSDHNGHEEYLCLSNDKRGRVERIRLCKDQEDSREDFPLTFDKQKNRTREQLRLCNNQEDRGERFPSSNAKKVCGRKRKLRLCQKQKGPGKPFRLGKVKKRRVEDVPIKSSDKSAPQSLSAHCVKVCPPHDVPSEHCPEEISPQSIFPVNIDEKLLEEQVLLSNDGEGRQVESPLSNDERSIGEQVPFSNNQESRGVDSPLSNDEKRSREQVPFSNDQVGGGVDSPLRNDEKTGSFASLDKALSSKMKGRPIKKYFKWSLETRLLLIDTVTMVDEDHASQLWTIERAMQMLCGATAEAAAAAVATISFPQQEKWQDVASRLPSIFDDSINQAKRWSICRSQFVKLKQYLKFMKPHSGICHKKSDAKLDPIMTSELCPKLTEYDAAFGLSEKKKGRGQRLSLRSAHKGHGKHFRLSNDERGLEQHLRLCNDQKGGEEDIPLSKKKQKCCRKQLRLQCNDQKERGERFPSSKDKVCGRKRMLRLCRKQKRPALLLRLGKVKKQRVEHVPIKGSDKSAPHGFSANCLKVCPSHGVSSQQCSKKFTPQGVYPLNNDEQLRGEQVPLNNDRKGRRRVDSALGNDERSIGEQVPLSNDQECCGVHSPLSNDEKSTRVQVPVRNNQEGRVSNEEKCSSREEVPLSSDQENHGVDSPLSSDQENHGVDSPLSSDQENHGVDSPLSHDERTNEEVPLSKNQGGRGVDSPLSNDEKRSTEDVSVSNNQEGHGVECASLSNYDKGSNGEDVALSIINRTGQGEDIPSSTDKQLRRVPPNLAAGRDEEDSQHGSPRQRQNSQQLSVREVSENRLVKITDFSRSNMFRWSEESRLQVIRGVMKMESQLSRTGQIKCWRQVAECLPKKLFWDVDVDRLAIIARKQFGEMRRKYLTVKENETTGAVTTPNLFNTMTENIIREMEIYEESLVRRPPPAGPTRELCIGTHQKVRWLTKKPTLLRIPKAQRGHGAIVVEIFILPSGCLEDNSSRCFNPEFDSYDNFTGRGEQSLLPYHMESSDYENRHGFERLHRHRHYQESGSDYDYRRSVHMQTSAAGSYSEEFNYSEKSYGENSEDREQCLHLQGRRTTSSLGNSEADWQSEPYYENAYERNVMEESPNRQQGCSSFISRRDHALDCNYRFENQHRLLCDSQRRMNSGDSEYPGWNSRGSQREDYDSASSGGRSKSLENSEAIAHGQWSNNSESKAFVRSDSGEPFQDGTREDSQWEESDQRDRQTSPTNQHHEDYDRASPPGSPPRKRARSNKGHGKNCEAIPSSSLTDFSEPGINEVAKNAPILDEILTKVDLEFSRLNWWVNHQLFPTGREKITSGIKSAGISDAMDKRLESAGAFDQVVSKCRQKRILWVLKAELQQVRLRLVDEMEKSSQVVVQEVLQSYKI